MRYVTLREHGWIARQDLGPTLFARLEAFDREHARVTGAYVFDWRYRGRLKATQFVGVVQVPGLAVEILPKADTGHSDDRDPGRARANLLYMLSLTRRVPVRERELAALQACRMPLLEALSLLFLGRLHGELRRGLHHSYIHREADERFLKGKLRVRDQTRRGVVHRERFCVAFDEFVADTPLNRVLKAAARRLSGSVQTLRAQQRVREALARFAGVRDTVVRRHQLDEIVLDRTSERFRVLLDFSRLLLFGTAPAPTTGRVRTFSLLFDMNTLFEEFVGEFIRRHAAELGLQDSHIHIQAAGCRRYLLREAPPLSMPRVRLKPDLVIRQAGSVRLVLDTKWKLVGDGPNSVLAGVSLTDVYQLYAYASRYACDDTILLYPGAPGRDAATYLLEGGPGARRLRIEFIDLSRDLRRQRDAVCRDLRAILAPPIVAQTEPPAGAMPALDGVPPRTHAHHRP